MRCLLLAMVAAVPAGCVSFSPSGTQSAIVRDVDTGEGLPDVFVVGVFGYEVNDLHSWKFRCSGIELARTNAAGEYEFSRPSAPHRVIAYKADYWMKYLSSVGAAPLPFAMTRRDPYPQAAAAGTNDARQAGDSQFARRFDAGRHAQASCPDFGPAEWKALRPLHAAMARDAIRSASTDGEKIVALELCRQAANEGDYGGRIDRIGDRYSFTGIEADRLKDTVPECLAPDLMAARMNADPGKGLVRTPIPVDSPRFLERAIIRDPQAYQKALDERSMTFTTIMPPGHGTPGPEDLIRCVGPAPVDGESTRRKMAGLMKAAGVPYRFEGNGASVCVRRADERIAREAAVETNAQLRDEY